MFWVESTVEADYDFRRMYLSFRPAPAEPILRSDSRRWLQSWGGRATRRFEPGAACQSAVQSGPARDRGRLLARGQPRSAVCSQGSSLVRYSLMRKRRPGVRKVAAQPTRSGCCLCGSRVRPRRARAGPIGSPALALAGRVTGHRPRDCTNTAKGLELPAAGRPTLQAPAAGPISNPSRRAHTLIQPATTAGGRRAVIGNRCAARPALKWTGGSDSALKRSGNLGPALPGQPHDSGCS